MTRYFIKVDARGNFSLHECIGFVPGDAFSEVIDASLLDGFDSLEASQAQVRLAELAQHTIPPKE